MFPFWSMTAVSSALFVMAHIWRTVKDLKPLTVRSSPPCCYFLFCSSKYSLQHSTLLKHPHIYSHLLSVKVRGSVSSNMKHTAAFSQPEKASSFCHTVESRNLLSFFTYMPASHITQRGATNMRTSLKTKGIRHKILFKIFSTVYSTISTIVSEGSRSLPSYITGLAYSKLTFSFHCVPREIIIHPIQSVTCIRV